MSHIQIPHHYTKVKDVSITPEELIKFETKVKDAYENAKVKGPIHLSKNNEKQLIKRSEERRVGKECRYRRSRKH